MIVVKFVVASRGVVWVEVTSQVEHSNLNAIDLLAIIAYAEMMIIKQMKTWKTQNDMNQTVYRINSIFECQLNNYRTTNIDCIEPRYFSQYEIYVSSL